MNGISGTVEGINSTHRVRNAFICQFLLLSVVAAAAASFKSLHFGWLLICALVKGNNEHMHQQYHISTIILRLVSSISHRKFFVSNLIVIFILNFNIRSILFEFRLEIHGISMKIQRFTFINRKYIGNLHVCITYYDI